jgi:hypothetical protein
MKSTEEQKIKEAELVLQNAFKKKYEEASIIFKEAFDKVEKLGFTLHIGVSILENDILQKTISIIPKK